jgi:hypothetical protein
MYLEMLRPVGSPLRVGSRMWITPGLFWVEPDLPREGAGPENTCFPPWTRYDDPVHSLRLIWQKAVQ